MTPQPGWDLFEEYLGDFHNLVGAAGESFWPPGKGIY